MPGRDGKGPLGKGPMTGNCAGSCLMKIPADRDEPVLGFAGKAGRFFLFGGKPPEEEEVYDMPRHDRTGPTGGGPGTGRRRGVCMGFGNSRGGNRDQVPASPGAGAGPRGQGRSMGADRRGRQDMAGIGRRSGLPGALAPIPDSTPATDLETLKVQAGHLKEALDEISRRIQDLESEGK
ncbi:MAG: DUF5320 domain-containing protein [Syntrophobacteraceae bacterium]